jgi:hypothetical protein
MAEDLTELLISGMEALTSVSSFFLMLNIGHGL